MRKIENESGFDNTVMSSTLGELDQWLLDARVKGIPSTSVPIRLSDVPAQNWNLLAGDLPAPVAILRQSAIDANAAWIKKLLARYGLLLAPHAKTTMSPHLFAHQADYCWGLTVATAQQAEVAAFFGCRKLILANELIGSSQVASIVKLLQKQPNLTVNVFVDSVEGVREIAAIPESSAIHPRLRLLVDVGFEGGRTGCRTLEQAKVLFDEIARCNLHLAGIGGYEGLIAAASGAEDAARVERYFDTFEQIAILADSQRLFAVGDVMLTAGGSSYYDVVGRRLQAIRMEQPILRIIRSGCYVTHDCGTYHSHQKQMAARAPELVGGLGDLEPALFVCGLVQSRPEPDLALITVGKRDVGIDADLPVPIWQYRSGRHSAPQNVPERWKIFRLNDQHAYLRISASDDVKIGDLICLGISHPCTTFDRWRITHLVNDKWTSIGVFPTFF